MPLYLGQNKVKINLNGVVYKLNIGVGAPAIIDNVLLSSDNFALQDSNGLYLIPKLIVSNNVLLSLDNYTLQDLNGVYLIPKLIAPHNVAISSDDYILQDSNQFYITLKEENNYEQ